AGHPATLARGRCLAAGDPHVGCDVRLGLRCPSRELEGRWLEALTARMLRRGQCLRVRTEFGHGRSGLARSTSAESGPTIVGRIRVIVATLTGSWCQSKVEDFGRGAPVQHLSGPVVEALLDRS